MSSADEPKAPNRAVPVVSAPRPGVWILSHDVRAIKSRAPLRLELLAFSDVVRYFSEERPAESGIAACALLRGRRLGVERPDSYFHFFLDDGDRPVPDRHGIPYGRNVEAAGVDEELAAAFARHDKTLLIFRVE